MAAGIFTVRFMLEALGVDDYGLQNVAGGVLGVFSFVIMAMGTSTSRFLTFELGRGEASRLRATFATSVCVFTALAGVLLLIGETAGLWWVAHGLNVPAGREGAAMIVYQLSVAGVVLTLPTTPYSACLTAHERFNIPSAINLLSTGVRLGVIMLLRHAPGDHLVLYSLAIFIWNLLSTAFLVVYCRRNFAETRGRLRPERELLRPMLRFSFWELFGTLGYTLKGPWFQMVINYFHGVAINAVIGIGLTVSGAVTGLAFTLSSAFKPVITKRFAASDLGGMKESVLLSTMLCMVLYGMIGLPLMVELHYVMELWLTDVPAYSYEICLIQLVLNIPVMAYLIPAETLKSMGFNKGINLLQVAEGALVLAAVWAVCLAGWSPVSACAVFRGGILVNFILTLLLLRRRVGGEFVSLLLSRSVGRVVLAEAVIFGILRSVTALLSPGPVRLVAVCMLSVVLFGAVTTLWLLSPAQKDSLRGLLRSRFPMLSRV